MVYDDSDMKIADTEQISGTLACENEAADTAELLGREKANGNLGRARRLGAILAEEVSSSDGEHAPDDSKVASATQRRILLAFAAEIGMEELLPSSLLAETAQSVFYETMRKTAAAFFEDLQDSGAFSFYRLNICDKRIQWDSEAAFARAGETYASLCGHAEEEALAAGGEKLYSEFVEQVKYFTNGMEFVK